jgi:hypothetical protein
MAKVGLMDLTEEATLVRTEIRRLAVAHPREARKILAGLKFLSPKLHALFNHYLKGISL